ncbi:helix-turn-helix transcriptional regulator [Streptomyces sp. NPDC088817]|uniref:helix-turn-helix transcriptional regulator n=1 Tax=Streptomyces sp. NPDC088817 TaxID=3365907 RepID=UPI0037F53413
MRTPVDPQRLARRRVERGLSQNALAREIGASKQLVSAVSRGRASFSPEMLGKVAEVLDCEIADLLPVDEAPARLKQLAELVAAGTVSFSPEDLGKVAEALGCDVADLPPEDLATVAELLGCKTADLLPDETELVTLSQGPA